MTKHSFAWSPIRELMKKEGASIVAREAVDRLIDHLEKSASELTNQAKQIALKNNRKKITTNDLIIATRMK